VQSLGNDNDLADYEFACFGNYSAVHSDNVTNGAPLR
jgi:hypothetical protein